MKNFTLICGLAYAALSANTAWAGEKSGHIFGGPVIFESSLSYGWMSDTSDQGLIRGNADGLVINNAHGGSFLAVRDNPPGIFTLIPATARLNYSAPQISASTNNEQLFDFGFSHSQELVFGIRSEIADGLEGFIRFEYAQIKPKNSKQQSFDITAVATTRYDRSNPIFGTDGIHYILPGRLQQTFTGTGLGKTGLSNTDIFNFNMGMKKNIFHHFNFANVRAQPFIDLAIGLAFSNEIAIESSGQVPDITNIVTSDFNRTFIFIDSAGSTTHLPTRAITASANVSQKIQAVKAAIKPTIIIGTGLDFSIAERTKLSLDVRYKYLEIDTRFQNQKINLSRTILSLRLSQTF